VPVPLARCGATSAMHPSRPGFAGRLRMAGLGGVCVRAATRNHCSRLALVPDADSGLFTDMR